MPGLGVNAVFTAYACVYPLVAELGRAQLGNESCRGGLECTVFLKLCR